MFPLLLVREAVGQQCSLSLGECETTIVAEKLQLPALPLCTWSSYAMCHGRVWIERREPLGWRVGYQIYDGLITVALRLLDTQCVMTPVRWRSLYQAVEKETTTCLIVFYSDQHGFILPDEFIVLSVSSIIRSLNIVKDTNMVVSPWRTSFEAEVEIRLNASWLGVSSVSDTTPEEYVEFSTSNKTSILSP